MNIIINQNDLCYLVPLLLLYLVIFSKLHKMIFYDVVDYTSFCGLRDIFALMIGFIIFGAKSCVTNLIGLTFILLGLMSLIFSSITNEKNNTYARNSLITILVIALLFSSYKVSVYCFKCNIN